MYYVCKIFPSYSGSPAPEIIIMAGYDITVSALYSTVQHSTAQYSTGPVL